MTTNLNIENPEIQDNEEVKDSDLTKFIIISLSPYLGIIGAILAALSVVFSWMLQNSSSMQLSLSYNETNASNVTQTPSFSFYDPTNTFIQLTGLNNNVTQLKILQAISIIHLLLTGLHTLQSKLSGGHLTNMKMNNIKLITENTNLTEKITSLTTGQRSIQLEYFNGLTQANFETPTNSTPTELKEYPSKTISKKSTKSNSTTYADPVIFTNEPM